MITYLNDDALDFTTQEMFDRESKKTIEGITYIPIITGYKYPDNCLYCLARNDIHLCAELPVCGKERRADKNTVYWRNELEFNV